MPTNWEAVTRCLRMSVVILVLAILATPLAACEDSQPASTPSGADYERVVLLEWYGTVYLPAWQDFAALLKDQSWLEEESVAGIRERVLIEAYGLKGALSRLPAVEPPSAYERVDEQLRGQMAVCGQGVDVLIGGIEADDEMRWGAGLQLVAGECSRTLDLWCYLPASSEWAFLCSTPTPTE